MTIASEITQSQTNMVNSYTACQNKGATMPASQNFDNLATCIASISSGGGSVDQTYNASSTNAQSGVAIAGAGFLRNQSTGSGGLAIGFDTANNVSSSTVLGSSGVITGAVHGAVVIGNNTSSSGGIAIGRDIHTNDGDIIIGDYTSSALVKDRVNQNPVFALSDYASSDHEAYALLDLTTGKIPNARINGVSGSFTSQDGYTITVTNGVITNIS